jgi:polyketide synthase PksM
MPGVVYLEMVRAALALAMRSAVQEEEHVLHLHQVVWTRPLVIGKQPVGVDITLDLQENRQVVFVISSQTQQTEDESREIVCQGRAELDVKEEVAQDLDLTAIQTRCQHSSLLASECYQRLHELSIVYGPAMQGIEGLSIGEGEFLARLRLPVGVDRDQPCPYMLHPSMLDAALQACIGLQASPSAHQNPQERLSATSMPFALDECTLVGAVPTQGWSWVRLRSGPAGQAFDIDVCDDAGRIAVRLRGLRIRQLPARTEETRTVLLESAAEEVGETYV